MKNSKTSEWVQDQIAGLRLLFENPTWEHTPGDAQPTKAQIGYLAGAMDLNRDDRMKMLAIILGTPITTTKGHPALTKWKVHVLLEYYINGEGTNLNTHCGFASQSDSRKAQSGQGRPAEGTAGALEAGLA